MGANISKLGKIDVRWLYIITIIMIIIPIIKPLGLPIEISQPTRDFYNIIKNLPEGSVVVWEEGGIPGQYDINRPSMVIALKVIFSLPIKLIIFSDSGGGPVLMKDALRIVNPEKFGKKLGEDYVVFGFAAGQESATASFATDMRKTFSTDYYDTPIEDIPMMKDINSAHDVDLIIQLAVGGYNPDWVLRQWVARYGTPYLAILQEAMIPGISVYYPEQCQGYLGGILGASELEIIANIPGEGATATDAKNLGLIPMVLFIILGNIAFINEYLSKKEEKK